MALPRAKAVATIAGLALRGAALGLAALLSLVSAGEFWTALKYEDWGNAAVGAFLALLFVVFSYLMSQEILLTWRWLMAATKKDEDG